MKPEIFKNTRNLFLQTVSFLIIAHCLMLTASSQMKDLTRYVNPFVGTGGHGHTFPGATVPFGAVQLSPDTRLDNWDGSSGYHYSDSIIYGFSHTHLSGTGIPDYCDILFAPYISKDFLYEALRNNDTKQGYASTFDHKDEKAEPGYYSVLLKDENIFAEMTATTHAGFQRYTFPETTDDAKITLDLKWRDKVLDSEIHIINNHTVEGFRRSKSWANDQVVYFYAEFSKPFFEGITVSGFEGLPIGYTLSSLCCVKGTDLKAVFPFKVEKGEQILVKVGISAIDIEGAKKNVQTEIPDWNFDKVRADAKTAWNKELNKIQVTDTDENNLKTFYSALYHVNIQPNVFQDVDGRYLGHDKQIHTADGFTNYTVFSLWDTFRAAHPLYTIIQQKRTVDFINTFIKQYEQGGRLPVWELAGNETDCMIGYHSVSVIADAMAKGIKGFDYDKAFEAAKYSAELNHYGLEAYKQRGYISSEDENESVSKTLEYAYDDYCIAQMAKILLLKHQTNIGNDDVIFDKQYYESKVQDIQEFTRRTHSFENLFDSKTGFMRPKQNGGFIKPFAPEEVTFNFTEGNSWVYSFFVPQDISRLMELYGGKQKFAQKLDELFTTDVKLSGREQPDITGLIGQYAHGNEPSHHIAYLYDYASEPWKTQMYVRKIMDEFYKNDPDGLIGNEDCGQMSAWFILSASGFYEVTPSYPIYVFGTPLFKEVKYNLENGKTFIIKAPNVSKQNIYIKSVKLNGKSYTNSYLTYESIMNGGILEFEMSPVPVKTASLFLPLFQNRTDFVPVSIIEGDKRVFNNQNSISIKTITSNAKIYYTTDGSEPNNNSNEYKNIIVIDKNTHIKAIAVNDKGEKSFVSEAKFIKKSNDWTVKIESKYNRQYTGGGDEGLIDGIRGTTTFGSGEWQGYQGQDFVAVVDLQRETEIKKVGGGFLQNARSWIWMPTHIEFEVSDDNVNFRKVADIKTDVAPEDMKEQIRDYVTSINPVKARYVKIKAYNLGKIPAWHPGAGDNAFIFVDEVIIE